jgi:prepilin-type N-terminal cleavage/methylation domain-containing protein
MALLKTPRRGLTLVEVLVSIFVMGIGLISLLVLFPLGSIYWANANKDDLTGHAAANANALAITFDLRHDPKVTPWFTTPPPGLNNPSATGPGYPVYVDPIAIEIGGFTNTPVASLAQGIPRVAPSYVQNSAISPQWAAEQYFSMLDNMSYDDNGRPVMAPPTVGQIERPPQSSFNWAYLMRPAQRDVNGVYSVYVTVVVYKQRSTVVLGETAYGNITYVPASQTVQVAYAGGAIPNIKKGGWILDATMDDTYRDPNDGNLYPAPHGFFYRVSNVVDIGGVLNVELETPLRNPNPTVTPWQTTGGVLVVLDDVAEVFERGP